jgi:hypothetical protein
MSHCDTDYDRLKNQVDKKFSIIKIHAQLPLTKGVADSHDSFTTLSIKRDFLVETKVKEEFSKIPITNRLKELDPEFNYIKFPNHYAGEILNSRNFDRQNVFFAMQKNESDLLKDQLGFEMLDQWRQIHKIMLKAALLTFNNESYALIYKMLSFEKINAVIYALALLHELGHSVTSCRVLPKRTDFAKLDDLFQGMLGETTANCVAAIIVSQEMPEIGLWVLAFHILVTGRKGFLTAPDEGWLNYDNDVLSSVFFFQKFLESGVLELQSDGLLNLSLDKLTPCFQKILDEIDLLSTEAFVLSEGQCNGVVRQFLAETIPFREEFDRFVFPGKLREIYQRISHLPDRPNLTADQVIDE